MNGSDPCSYQPQGFIEWKFFFVGIIGFITAMLSIAHNCLLYYSFVVSRVLRRRRLTYLKWISLCDIFVSISYIAIMCVQVYFDYFESFTLYYLWHSYLVVAFTVSHITISSTSFLLMAATIERYLQCTVDTRSKAMFRFLRSNCGCVVFVCFLSGTILRGTVLFEITIIHNPACESFASMAAGMVDLTDSPLFDIIWRFYVRKIFTVFLPFVVLAYFNFAIVMNVQRTDRDQTVKRLVLYVTVGSRGEVGRLQSRLRTVTRMLVLVVFTYLLSNIIDVIIAILENVNNDKLLEYPGLYTVASDVSSYLPIVACAVRLPIYALNDKTIWREVCQSVLQLRGRRREKTMETTTEGTVSGGLPGIGALLGVSHHIHACHPL